MNKLKRDAFLKMGALALLNPLSNGFMLQVARAGTGKSTLLDEDLLKRLQIANDLQVTKLLQTIQRDNVAFSRKIGNDFSILAASYCYPGSTYFHSSEIVSKLEILVLVLTRFQTADGTVNIGNLESPPDTAFLLDLLVGGATLLAKDNFAALVNIKNEIRNIILKGGEALVTGGVHTPNHRWVVSAALAGLNALYPHQKYVDRIEDWLGEGVYIDTDGHYPERSGIYSHVENQALITMGRLLNKPTLFEPVRKNLAMTWYYMEPNGDLVTTDSRRQDQYTGKTIVSFYLHYRYLAIRDCNSNFAAITRMIEGMEGFEKEILEKAFFNFLEEPLLQQTLPAATLPAEHFQKLFTTSSLLRIRKGDTTATLFGGADWPIIIASGRSNSPNFFSYRKGKAILKYIRLSTGFFSMGYFYSNGIRQQGNKFILHNKLNVPYYQPLPQKLRNNKGDYKLSPSVDDRFWNKMDFTNRPVSNVKTQETTITLIEKGGRAELSFEVAGLPDVPVTIELCFMEGGTLTGVMAAGNGNHFLENGNGEYEYGGDKISFGPGAITHKNITAPEGERYSTHFGTLRTEGMHVYLTGKTPFKHTLVIG